ncbi:hypothetical protein AB0B52_32895 [Streptomyces griseofuscus]|uniref:hypothetical protein n=1 Tax=Streptomyces griseofuscus TaxID=146922 RepID=UPI0033E7AB86
MSLRTITLVKRPKLTTGASAPAGGRRPRLDGGAAPALPSKGKKPADVARRARPIGGC